MQYLWHKGAEVPNSVQLLWDNTPIVRKDMYLIDKPAALASRFRRARVDREIRFHSAADSDFFSDLMQHRDEHFWNKSALS